MRNFLVTLVLLFAFSSNAQLLIPEETWFDMNGFFKEEQIKLHRIWHIQVETQDKNDGEYIRKSFDKIDYFFNKKGQLEYSSKILKYSSTLDSMHLYLYYNEDNQLSKKREKQGYFDFSFLYEYQGGQLQNEIKLDTKNNRNDTLYQRSFKYELKGDREIQYCYNEAGKEFMRIELLKQENRKEKRFIYTRTGLYRSIQWHYDDGRLTQKITTSFGSQKEEEVWHYYYKNQLLEELFQFDEEGNKKIRMAILRDEKGLPVNLIERNYPLKRVRIYNLSYEQY